MLIRHMKLKEIPSFTLPLVPSVQTDKPLYSVGTLFMEEIWKDVVGLEGKYQVSNLSRVKNLQRSVEYLHNGEKRKRTIRERILKITNNRYKSVLLGNSNNVLLHRIIAQAFIPNPDNKPCVNHIDGNKHNNSLNNLEWSTYSENIKHSFDKLNRISNKNKPVIIKNKTGNIYFDSVKECCEHLNIDNKNFSRYIKKRKNIVYMNEEQKEFNRKQFKINQI